VLGNLPFVQKYLAFCVFIRSILLLQSTSSVTVNSNCLFGVQNMQIKENISRSF